MSESNRNFDVYCFYLILNFKKRLIINERPIRRSGPVLVEFFNSLGFCDTYTHFPARYQYTDEKLKQINGTPRLGDCIKILFNPQKYIGNYPVLKETIDSFNEFLAYDD